MAVDITLVYYKNDGTSTHLGCTGLSSTPTDYITSVGESWDVSPAQDWSRSGYAFVCWNTAADGSGTSYIPPAQTTGGIQRAVYAIWQVDADVVIDLGSTTIATMSATGTKTLATQGTYVADDITIEYTKPTPNLQTKSVTPSTSSQTITPDSGYDGLDIVTISAMPSGTAGTPTASKGTVSNNSVSVTPSVTNTTGYITGSTLTGTAVTISASELVSGTKSITANGTGIDVTNYASVDVAIPAPSLQNKTVTPTTSQQSISADSGYDGLGTVIVNAMPSGTAGTPTASKGTVSNHSIAVTPSVTNTTGYITGSTKTGTAVTVSASELVSGTKSITANGVGIDVTNYASVDVLVSVPTPTLQSKTVSPTTSQQIITADGGYDGLSSVQVNAISPTKAAQTYTPTTSNQTITSGQWLTGAQTILGDANLVAGNIKNNVSIFGVTGTYSGGGGGGTTTVTANVYITGDVEYINSSGVPSDQTGVSLNDSLSVQSGSLIAVCTAVPLEPDPMTGYFQNATLVRTYQTSGRTKVYVYYFQAD